MAKYFVPLVATPPLDNGGGGGGSDLPAVSAADNGDVLTVVNGEWDKAAPGGGGGGGSSVLVVNVTWDDDTGIGTCDKTAGEMWQAAQTGLVILANEDTFYHCIKWQHEDGENYSFNFLDFPDNLHFRAPTSNDYPYYFDTGD